jgi:DNA-binding transcriptional regulator of glucitol operon
VRRVLLSPRWLLGHLLALAAAVVCVRLGWWQWQRGQVTGSLQNYGYALQWPVIGLFVLGFWARVVRDQVHPARPGRGRQARQIEQPPAPPPPPLVPDDPADAELIAYNRYLAWLAEQDRKAQ